MRKRHFLGLMALPPALWALHRLSASRAAPSNPLQGLLASEAEPGFSRVEGPEPFHFPEDHGPHPDYRHEWWYFTGNLVGPGDQAYGFQLTFFRFAITAESRHSDSRWNTRQAMLGHFALTDVRAQRFHSEQRLERPVLGLAGMDAFPAKLWIRDWHARHVAQTREAWELEATTATHGLSLLLTPLKDWVGQGEQGYSRKGPGEGNASRYYSGTRLAAKGKVMLAGTPLEVVGRAWLDREWGTSALAPGTRGWDWFGLQLDDGSDLMVYLLRQENGRASSFSAGSLVSGAGAVIPLVAQDLAIEVQDTWISPHSGRRYPARWRLRIARRALDLEITPRVADQEWQGLVRYWEGCVTVEGVSAGSPVKGLGYAELTGY
ncbi:MAG: carotenoid 1,2-hydratase [Gammaproteobacteria bacterium]|nr:carotenoid 1,2-hydratase [Gammaproteobacteria bacterium]